MGSGESKQGHVKGSMFVSLESNSVMPGGVLHGSVHITLAEQLTNPVLYLIFKGTEVTDFKTQHQFNKRAYYKSHTGKQTLCKLKTVLYHWPNSLALPGNFSFPFELKVSDNILPSFHAFSNFGGFCQINYSLNAKLHAADVQPLEFKVPVSVFSNSVNLSPEMYPQSLTRDCPGHGSIFCCIKKEYAESRISIERDTFGNLDYIDINLDTNLSTFSANVIGVGIKVNKILTMTANKKSPRIVTQVVDMLNIAKRPEIKAFSGPQNFSFRIPIQSILKNEHCYSMSSKLIQCHFVLHVKLYTELYCFKCYGFDESNQVIVILPFQTQAPMIAPPIAPEKWQAQILPKSFINPNIQDSNNPNPLIEGSFPDKSESDYKVIPSS